jgi:3'(2'), 5'-bisphosphate nucleotidase
MPQLPLDSLAAAIRDIALRAGREILAVYDSDFAVRSKEDHSPVTAADEAAETLILTELAKLDPPLPVLAEESFARGEVPDIGHGPFWAVDPLDGTKEFVSRNGEFTVNIGLIENAAPVAGVVYAPSRNSLYLAAGPGKVTAEIDGAPPRSIMAAAPGGDGFVVVASRSHRNAETDAYLETLQVRRITSAGSSLKFCIVASGEADVYPRLGRTMEWDTAAGHAILATAGGSVRTVDGAELTYGKPGFENPPFIAWGRSRS